MLLRAADKLASIKNLHEPPPGLNLALMRAQMVGQREEGLNPTVISIERHCSDEIGPF